MSGHNALLDEWSSQPAHRGRPFIRDGIIDSTRWERAPRRVLLLLKEAYGKEGASEGFDLREVIRNEWVGPKYKMWWTAAYWCFGIHRATPRFPPFPEDESSRPDVSEALLGSAIVNIKKCDGRSVSDDEEIANVATRDGSFILAQVDAIDPQIVVCGNTWWAVKHLWPDASRQFDLVWRVGKRWFVDYWHPANQYPNQLNYYALGCLLAGSGALVGDNYLGRSARIIDAEQRSKRT